MVVGGILLAPTSYGGERLVSSLDNRTPMSEKMGHIFLVVKPARLLTLRKPRIIKLKKNTR
jgi:hypothetical protein